MYFGIISFHQKNQKDSTNFQDWKFLLAFVQKKSWMVSNVNEIKLGNIISGEKGGHHSVFSVLKTMSFYLSPSVSYLD